MGLIRFHVSPSGSISVLDAGIWVLIYASSIAFVLRISWYEKKPLISEYACSTCIYKNLISRYEFLKWSFQIFQSLIKHEMCLLIDRIYTGLFDLWSECTVLGKLGKGDLKQEWLDDIFKLCGIWQWNKNFRNGRGNTKLTIIT